MPIIPIDDWPDIYEVFLRDLLTRVPLSRIILATNRDAAKRHGHTDRLAHVKTLTD